MNFQLGFVIMSAVGKSNQNQKQKDAKKQLNFTKII